MYRIVLILLLFTFSAHADSGAQYDTISTEAYVQYAPDKKIAIIQSAIDKYEREGVKVKYTSREYVEIIGNILATNPDYIGVPLKQMFEEMLQSEGSLPKKK